jgi:hypothetical protein
MKSHLKAAGEAASELISERIAELGGWRGDTLARTRALIREAAPDVVEEDGYPGMVHDGGICTGESYKPVVKLTFLQGSFLAGFRQAFQLEPLTGTQGAPSTIMRVRN